MNIFDILRPPTPSERAGQVHILIKSPRRMNLWHEFVSTAGIDRLRVLFIVNYAQFAINSFLCMFRYKPLIMHVLFLN